MKKITVKIQESSINEIIGKERKEIKLFLYEKANIIDVIKKIDKIILRRGNFPSNHYGCLLHWMYNPVENRFYEQTGIHTSTPLQPYINVRNNPKIELPDNTTIILLPSDPCASSPDTVLSYNKFLEAMTSTI